MVIDHLDLGSHKLLLFATVRYRVLTQIVGGVD